VPPGSRRARVRELSPRHCWAGAGLARHRLRLRGGDAETMMDVEEAGARAKEQRLAAPMSDSEVSASDDGEAGQCVVVPAEETLLDALEPALGEEDDQNRPRVAAAASSFSITITEGKHNLTDAGELALCRRVHLVAAQGVTLAASAQPRPSNSLIPTVGGGRFRFMAGSTGSTMSGVMMISANIQCAIISSAAVLFDSCELRTSKGDEDASCIFIRDAGHATITSSTLGGVTVSDQASQAVVVDGTGAEAVLADTLLENCYGSTVIVCNNGTVRLSACQMRDSFAAFSVSDYDTVSTASSDVPARIEAFNCTVQCVAGMWRDDVRASFFLEVNTSHEMYAFKELAEHDVDGRLNRTIQAKMSWDPERNAWRHSGMTRFRREQLHAYYERYRINGTVDPRAEYRQMRREQGRRSWESSDEEREDGGRPGSSDVSSSDGALTPWNQAHAAPIDRKQRKQLGELRGPKSLSSSSSFAPHPHASGRVKR
jgi:hypothetical protein